MTKLTEILSWLDELLRPGDFSDYCPNGLQVEGAAEVTTIVSGVSISLDLIDAAVARGAQAVLVHHGLFWKNDWPHRVKGAMRRRLGALLENDVSLVAYHLPLDAHPEVGNNAVAARRLGLTDVQPFGVYNGKPIGQSGALPAPLTPVELSETLRGLFDREPLLLEGSRQCISRVGVVSGGAGFEFSQAIDAGLDAYITGEPIEPAMHLAREEGVHFFSCGHYATERFGVQALGARLADQFGVEVEFLELENPV